MPRGWVHGRLMSGRALLLVDGVDEVTASQRQAVRQWVRGLAGEFPGIRVVVTSRPAAAAADWLRAEGFATSFLEQLGPADLNDCEKVADLGPLAAAPQLRELMLLNMSREVDLSPLAGNRRLTVTVSPGQEVINGEAFGRRLRSPGWRDAVG
ncbi:hypothetical protein GCM10010191_30390 [Actinomadura vinacea]|uniref:NACHT domain-containing protein n=2 Tax=Actinomadura vinacea TaxID=115336 RepID=A0ABN3J0W2_9ACTN